MDMVRCSFDVPRGPMRRYHLPIATGGPLSLKDLNYGGFDLMAIHPLLKGKQHRYVSPKDPIRAHTARSHDSYETFGVIYKGYTRGLQGIDKGCSQVWAMGNHGDESWEVKTTTLSTEDVASIVIVSTVGRVVELNCQVRHQDQQDD